MSIDAKKLRELNDESDAALCGPITHDEARDILQRFIDGHFKNAGKEGPRISIPADPRRDDDLRLCSYIAQQKRLADEVERLRKALERISMNTNDNGSGAADFARTALAKPANGGGE